MRNKFEELVNNIRNTLSTVKQRVTQPRPVQVSRPQIPQGVRNIATNVGNFLNSGVNRVKTEIKNNPQSFNFIKQVDTGNLKTGIKPLDSGARGLIKISAGIGNILNPPPTEGEKRYIQAFGDPKKIAALSEEDRKAGQMKYLVNPVIGAGGASPFAKSTAQTIAKRFAPKLTKEDIKLIGRFAEIVESKGPKADLGDVGKTVQSLAENMFGRDAATWGNAKLKNAFDLVLQKIGNVPNRAGLGQASVNIRDEGKKVVEQTFRTDKLNLTKDLTNRIKAIQEELGLGTRAVRTFEDMKDLAAEVGTNPQQLIKDITNSRITDKEVIALRNLINNNAQRISIVEKKLRSNPTSLDLQRQAAALEDQLNLAVRKLITGGTEAGRAVVAFKIIANKNLDPVFWLKKAQQQLGNKELTQEHVTAINDLIKGKDRLGLARFISLLGESTGPEKAVSLWKAGLLTNPTTHIANMTSNTTMQVLENVKDVVGTPLDIAASAITGKRSTTLPSVGPQIEGVKKGFQVARDYMKSGVKPEDIAKVDLQKVTRYGNSVGGRIAQKYTDTVFRLLGAEDAVFKEAAFAKNLRQQAVVIAKNTGQKLDELVKNPTREMIDNAIAQAEYATFTKDNALANAFAGFKRSGNAVSTTAAEVIAPFSRTPTNVAEVFMDYSPLGPVKTVLVRVGKGLPLDQKTMVDAISRATTGTSIFGLGAYLASKGLVTGSSPDSEAERAQWELEGKTPNSILIGDKWRRLTRLSPIGNLLSLGAEFIRNEGSAVATAGGAAKGLTEQTFLKGVSGALGALTEPERKAERFIQQTIASTVPSLIAAIARGIDPYEREAGNLRQEVAARVPGAREELLVRRDALGRPVKRTGGLVGALFDPFASSTDKRSDPVISELNRVGYNLNKIDDKIAGEKLTQAQKDDYQKIVGQYVYQTLEQMFASAQYQQAPQELQNYMVERIVNQAKDRARALFQAKSGVVGEAKQKFVIQPTTTSTGQIAGGGTAALSSGATGGGGGGVRVRRPKAPTTPPLKKVVVLKKSSKAKKPKKIRVVAGGDFFGPNKVPQLA